MVSEYPWATWDHVAIGRGLGLALFQTNVGEREDVFVYVCVPGAWLECVAKRKKEEKESVAPHQRSINSEHKGSTIEKFNLRQHLFLCFSHLWCPVHFTDQHTPEEGILTFRPSWGRAP